MIARAIPFACGVVFALGLGLAGMTRPERVLAFLEFRDPALLYTMGGAVLVTFFGFPLVLRRARPLVGLRFALPERRDIDTPLIAGAAVFGVGWGLAGLCPGPAITDLVALDPRLIGFVAAMLLGMLAHKWLQGR